MKNARETLEIHLTEVKDYKLPDDVRKLLTDDMLRGKGFEACHQAIRQQTGIWVPELEQVFKDLDSLLGLPSPGQ